MLYSPFLVMLTNSKYFTLEPHLPICTVKCIHIYNSAEVSGQLGLNGLPRGKSTCGRMKPELNLWHSDWMGTSLPTEPQPPSTILENVWKSRTLVAVPIDRISISCALHKYVCPSRESSKNSIASFAACHKPRKRYWSGETKL